MLSPSRPSRAHSLLLAALTLAVAAGMAPPPAEDGRDRVAPPREVRGGIEAPMSGQELLPPLVAVPAPLPGVAEVERPLGTGPALWKAGRVPAPARPSVAGPAGRRAPSPLPFGAAGADRCRLVCVFRL